MKLLSLKESDEKKLKEGIAQLRDLYERLNQQYSLKSDLVEVTDRRFALRAVLENELNIIREQQEKLSVTTTELSQLKSKLNEALGSIESLQEILETDAKGESIYSKILDIVNEDNLNSLLESSDAIHEKYYELFDKKVEGELSLIQNIENKINEISEKYQDFFVDLNENKETKFEEFSKKINSINEYYKDFFYSDDPEILSKKEVMNNKMNDIEKFYDKINGNENKNIPSLKKALEERLLNLENIEQRAKSVIGLSSEAGLAGGFVIKGNEAKTGRLFSLKIFIIVVSIIFCFNFYLFDKSDFLNMNWDTFIFKLLINAPLVWIATIANINLNKFSRLEQEYSHKEALAKSYERYKTEIQELEKLGVAGAEELKLRLLEINLEAFRVNPAEHSDKAKSDFSILEIFKNRTAEKKIE